MRLPERQWDTIGYAGRRQVSCRSQSFSSVGASGADRPAPPIASRSVSEDAHTQTRCVTATISSSRAIDSLATFPAAGGRARPTEFKPRLYQPAGPMLCTGYDRNGQACRRFGVCPIRREAIIFISPGRLAEDPLLDGWPNESSDLLGCWRRVDELCVAPACLPTDGHQNAIELLQRGCPSALNDLVHFAIALDANIRNSGMD